MILKISRTLLSAAIITVFSAATALADCKSPIIAGGKDDSRARARKLAQEQWQECAADRHGRRYSDLSKADPFTVKCDELRPRTGYSDDEDEQASDCGTAGRRGRWICTAEGQPCN
jgi:hypothetical protein